MLRITLYTLLLLPLVGVSQNDFKSQDSLIKGLKLRKKVKYLYTSFGKDSTLVEEEVYDTNGYKTERYVYRANGIIASKSILEYDKDGLLNKSMLYENGDLKSITNYYYDTEKRQTETVTRRPDSSIRSWGLTKYYKGQLVSGVFGKGKKENSLIPRRLVTYDSLDRIVSMKWYSLKGKVETTSFYSYNGDYHKVYIYSDEKKKTLSTVKTYNTIGQLIESNGLRNKRKTTYHYDPNGLLSYSVVYINGRLNHLIGIFYHDETTDAPLLFPSRKL